jgi:hypothetical protein
LPVISRSKRCVCLILAVAFAVCMFFATAADASCVPAAAPADHHSGGHQSHHGDDADHHSHPVKTDLDKCCVGCPVASTLLPSQPLPEHQINIARASYWTGFVALRGQSIRPDPAPPRPTA